VGLVSQIIPYREQIAARGVSDNTQNPDTADGGIGVGGRALGQALGQFAAHQHAVEEDQGRMWAANAAAENEVQQQKLRADRVNALDPSAPDYVDKINALPDQVDQDYQASVEKLQDQAPNDAARRYLAMHAASGHIRAVQGAIGESANLNAAYAVDQVGKSVKSATDIIAGSPDNGTYQSVVDQHKQAIMGLTTVDPNTKLKLAEQATHQFAIAQVQSVAAQNPQSFLQMVNATGGTTTRNGVRGAVPGGAPDMLTFANQQLAAGVSPDEAVKAAVDKFKPAGAFAYALAPDGKSFVDKAASGDPQVQPLTDGDIAAAKVPLAGWDTLTWPEKVSAVRSAEAQVGKQLAEDRGALSRELQDANAALQDGKPYPGMGSPRFSEANLRRVFGDDQGSRMAQELAYNANIGNFVSKAKVMPAAQRNALLAQLEPQPGEGYAEKARTYEMAQRAVKQVEAQQQAKPIESAIASGIGGAKPLDFSQPLAPQLRDRTAVASTMVRDYGTKAQIFTDAEVEQIAGSLGNMTGKDRIATLASIRTGLSDPGAFATAMNQLAPKNPNLAYAGNLAARGGTAFVDGKPVTVADVAATIADGDIILNGRNLDRQMAKGDDPSMPGGAKATNFKEADFRTYFQQSLGGAFRTPDAQLSAATEQSVYNAVKAYYAADSYRQGKPLDQIDASGVKRAIEAVVGSPWQKNGGTLLAPYGMPVEQFQSQWNVRAEAAIKAAGYDDTATGRFLDRAVPVNLADGKYGFQVGTGLLADPKTGRKVIVDYSQPFTAPVYPDSEVRSRAPTGGSPLMRRY
jgi:hypothetical protein